MELKIDGQICDLKAGSIAVPGYDAARLAPHEFEALLTPGTGAPDIRSVFRIDTGAGVVRAALHAVGDYDPAKASVRCTFNRLMED